MLNAWQIQIGPTATFSRLETNFTQNHHHDIEIEDDTGRRLARARLPEGMEGIAKLHALIAEHAPAEWVDLPADQVVVGIETDRGPWVVALQAAGYLVFAINPLSAARYRQRHSTSGAKSDAGDAHVLAEIVRVDRAHHRQIAGDSDLADAVKLLTRAHQNAIWERTRHVLRLRSALNEFFPAAVHAFPDLAAPDALILLGRAPDPARAGHLTRSQVMSALRAAGRHHVQDKADPLCNLLRTNQLRQPATLEAAYATIVSAQVKILTAINEQIASMLGTGLAARRILRCHPHDPSWQNWPVLEHAVIGNIVPDFPLINKSFNLSYSGQDL